MKRQFIYAVNAQELRHLVPQGLNKSNVFATILKDEYAYIAQREQLESNPSYWQLLPYITVTRDNEVFVYQRSSKVGEQRLSGNYSIGVGGHIDLADTQYRTCLANSDVDLAATVMASLLRELNEELLFSHTHEGHTEEYELVYQGEYLCLQTVSGTFNQIDVTLEVNATLLDTSNAVGLHHLGLVTELKLPSYIDVTCKEEELTSVGFLPFNYNYLSIEYPGVMERMEAWSAQILKKTM